MIVSWPTGGRGVVAPPNVRRVSGFHHDAWPEHAVYIEDLAWDYAASGEAVLFFVARLKDGQYYWYVPPGTVSPAVAEAAVLAYQDYVNRDGLRGFYGEWFNFVWRGSGLTKLDVWGYLAWLGTH